MKKVILGLILPIAMSAMLFGCGTSKESVGDTGSHGDSTSDSPRNSISEQMAYDGVYNYCHSAYDWSIAEDNPDIMSLEMGEENETEYQVVFRSYTGAFVYFYVDKANAETRLVECVPSLGIEEETGRINLYDYLDSTEENE